MTEPNLSLPADQGTPSPQRDDLRAAVQSSCEKLQPLSEADWSGPAAGLEWDCRYTLEHMLNVMDNYSRNLATPRSEPPPRIFLRYPDLTVGQLLTILQLRGGVLATIVRASEPTVRGYHVFGRPDPAGYVAMGSVELLLHTDDISRALGATYQPPEVLCQRILARLFPWAPTDGDPWSALRWATGRQTLEGQADTPATWAWHASPVAEWDGTVKTQQSYGLR